MDIIVEGVGKKYYKPDEVIINLEFYTRADSYDGALEQGTRDVEIFIEDILGQMQISEDTLKTRSFRVYEEKRYDYERKKQYKLGFAYTQAATLEFDYSMNTIAEFMDKVSKLRNAPKYNLQFSIKDIKQSKKEALAEAYNNAREKAENIADAANKKLKECVKVDFRPFEERVISNSRLNSLDMVFEGEKSIDAVSEEKMGKITADVIQNIFTPEDVTIMETLYCLWIAE